MWPCGRIHRLKHIAGNSMPCLKTNLPHRNEEEWKEAEKRCRLNDEEVRMAKELGINARSLIKNIPSRNQPWKSPVKQWVRSLYYKKFQHRDSQANARERSPVLQNKNGEPSSFPGSAAPDPTTDIDIPF
jgi:hypothetical protein